MRREQLLLNDGLTEAHARALLRVWLAIRERRDHSGELTLFCTCALVAHL